jgi:cytochrome P450
MWVMIQAALDPDLMARLRDDITKCQTGPDTFDMRKVSTSPRIKGVYLEALRWATASPSPRVVQETTELGGYTLLRGNLVMVHTRTLQMDESIWNSAGQPPAEEFWAERFLNGDDAAEANRVEENREALKGYEESVEDKGTPSIARQVEPLSGPKSKEAQQRMLALRPFGGGRTLCSGRHFATNEILGGLAAILMRLDIEVDQEALKKNGVPQVDLWKQGGLLPDRPLKVRIRRRRPHV